MQKCWNSGTIKILKQFWRTTKMPLINFEISLDLTRSKNYVISSAVRKTEFAITDTKIYVPVVTLPTEDNVELLKQLESGFKKKINWNKYQHELKTLPQNKYLNYLIGPSFQGVSRPSVSLFENETDRKVHTKNYLPIAEIKN